MRLAFALALSLAVAGLAGVATAAAPVHFDVQVHGTMTYRYDDQFTTRYPNGGSGCTVVVTQESHDTMTFSTEPGDPIKLDVANGRGAATAAVPYVLDVLPASQTSSEPTGVGPDGGPCPAYTAPVITAQCGVYKGSLPLKVLVDGRDVAISSVGRHFKGVACSGGSPGNLFVVRATGTLKTDHGGRVAGQGHQGNDDSTFAATFVAP
jgi:hypothetical protein